MEPTATEIAAHFAAMEDAPLLLLAEERDDLTDKSQALLLGELTRRSLPIPAIVPQPEEPTYDTRTWVTVERFRDLSSGIVARGALQAAGIPCFLRDENTVRLDWQISNFIGGMRLQVPAADEANARTVLAGLALHDDPASDAGAALPDEVCPTCGSANISPTQRYRWLSLLTLWLFSAPLAVPRGRRQWHCNHCNATWTDPVTDQRL